MEGRDNVRKAFLTILFLSLIVIGCVTRYQSRWTKSDFNMQEFRKADTECAMHADQIKYQAAYSGNLFQEKLMQDAYIRAYENCMTLKGYTKVE